MKGRIVAGTAVLLLSVAGLAHLKSSEALRLTAYADPGTGGAPWTICWGHTGPEVYPGLIVSKAQCESWLRQDIAEAESCLYQNVRVPLRQGAWDAYTSFVFNVGCGKFRSSTMLRLLNSGQYAASCDQFPRWVYANKRVLNGLKVRRTEEQAICHQRGSYVYLPQD